MAATGCIYIQSTQRRWSTLEIRRPTNLTTIPRPVDHRTKEGSFPGCAATVALLPEYEIGVVVNFAGPNADGTVTSLFGLVEERPLPCLDELARKQAEQKYAGMDISHSQTNNATLHLELDNGPGMRVSEWTNRGSNMIDSLATALLDLPNGSASAIDVRIYPSGSGIVGR